MKLFHYLILLAVLFTGLPESSRAQTLYTFEKVCGAHGGGVSPNGGYQNYIFEAILVTKGSKVTKIFTPFEVSQKANQFTITDRKGTKLVISVSETGFATAKAFSAFLEDALCPAAGNNTAFGVVGPNLALTDPGGTFNVPLSFISPIQTVSDGTSIDFTLAGTNLTGVAKVSAAGGNVLTSVGDGLYVPTPAGSNNISLEVDGPDLELTDAGGTLAVPLLDISAVQTINNSQTIEFVGGPGELQGDVQVSANPGNTLQIFVDGLYGTETPAGGSTTEVQFNNSGIFDGDPGLVYLEATDRLGVGTGTPDEQLHVNGATDGARVLALFENSQANSAGSTNEEAQIRFGFGTDNDAARIAVGKINDYTSGALSDSYMAFYTDRDGTPTEAARINQDGRIGINTTDFTTDVSKLIIQHTGGESGIVVRNNTLGNTGGTITAKSTTAAGGAEIYMQSISSTGSAPYTDAAMLFSGQNTSGGLKLSTYGSETISFYRQYASTPVLAGEFSTTNRFGVYPFATGTTGIRAKVGGVVSKVLTNASNSGTGETDVATLDYDDMLTQDGDQANLNASGILASSINAKTIRVYWDETVIATFSLPVSTAFDWEIRAKFIRETSTTGSTKTVLTIGSETIAVASSGTAINTQELTSLDFTNGAIFKITAQGGASTEITLQEASYEWKPTN